MRQLSITHRRKIDFIGVIQNTHRCQGGDDEGHMEFDRDYISPHTHLMSITLKSITLRALPTSYFESIELSHSALSILDYANKMLMSFYAHTCPMSMKINIHKFLKNTYD